MSFRSAGFSFFCVILLTTLICRVAAAQDHPASPASDKPSPPSGQSDLQREVPALAPVTVLGRPEDTLTGVNSFDRQILERLPARNNSINEAISIMPGVQLPEQSRSSLTAGEIVPPLISISGGKTYQNNFLIDGLGNNSLLDPTANDPTSITTVPGHPQAIFLDTSLVEDINVYRYNIPARYGRFTGGVVEATTRKAAADFFAEINYRTTRDAWTKTHVDDDIEEDFENSSRATYQHDFEKHLGGALLNIPLSDRLSLLASYQLIYSDISLQHLGGSDSQTRKNENVLFKLGWEIDSRSELETTFQYAPYEGDYFYPDSEDSDFTIKGGGKVASLTYSRSLPVGELTLAGAWKYSRNQRDGPPDLRPWLVSADKPWGEDLGTTSGSKPVSFEGGIGSLDSSQEGGEFNLALEEALFITGPVTHQMSAGLKFERAIGHFDRDEPTSSYYRAVADESVVCPAGSKDCIDGQQYFNRRLYFAADSIRADINFWEAYFEDKLAWRDLELRPGVRVSYDDFMENTNIAPRLAASYDLFGNGRSLLFGGLNRYYGTTLLTYKLREASQPFQTQLRDPETLEWSPQDPLVIPSLDFVNDRRGRAFIYSELDTPYTDEAVLGINQRLFGGQLVLSWVKREGRDEFLRETVEIPTTLADGTPYLKETYQLSNNGKRSHDEYTLEWERAWRKHYLSVNATYQETETNNEDFSNTLSLEDTTTIVWYEGDYLNLDEIPRTDFNRPWTINLIYSARLPWNITFTNITRYQSGYEGLEKLSKTRMQELGLPSSTLAYQKDRKSDSWVFDWQFTWQKLLPRAQRLALNLEVDNVFNAQVETGDPTRLLTYQTYQTGRQFWLGMSYSF
jgi:hypothetical protein